MCRNFPETVSDNVELKVMEMINDKVGIQPSAIPSYKAKVSRYHDKHYNITTIYSSYECTNNIFKIMKLTMNDKYMCVWLCRYGDDTPCWLRVQRSRRWCYSYLLIKASKWMEINLKNQADDCEQE